MKSLRQVLQIPWTARKTNDWVCETAGVVQSLLKSVKTRKLTYFGHVMCKEGECLENDIIQGTIPGT